ncbi:cytochrome c oxidase assembly protein [Benzoatithermus flavus]|uniref:Cytochrome c oxidase assembly protein CtaG n=1 Tax=Benzoatithermus flavus TaxID=3108223 RepID=A0ABU8XMG7_9PROT
MTDLGRRNRRTAVAASVVIVAMLGLTALSVPLYNLFCAVTGYGGTPRLGGVAAGAATTDRTVTVFFNADTDPDLPWTFRPVRRSLDVKVGEQTLAFYEAANHADHPVVGRAVYNVTPFKVGSYFSKIHCFCFEEQTLKPGERVEMPVSFYVDPAMLEDANTGEVTQITLSYTFYIDKEATAKLQREHAAGGSTS